MTDGPDGEPAGKPDTPVIPPAADPAAPVTPPAKVDPVKDDKDKLRTENTVTVTKEEFANLQNQILKLQKDADTLEKSKDDALRKLTLDALKAINPKLAEINKDASLSTLQVVIETSKEIKNDFPSLDPKNKKPVKATVDDHDSMEYDFDKKEWIYN